MILAVVVWRVREDLHCNRRIANVLRRLFALTGESEPGDVNQSRDQQADNRETKLSFANELPVGVGLKWISHLYRAKWK